MLAWPWVLCSLRSLFGLSYRCPLSPVCPQLETSLGTIPLAANDSRPPVFVLPAFTCLRRSRWFVTSSIIGATSLPQLKENLDAFSLTLPEEAFEDINAIYRKFRDPPTSA